MPGRLFLLIFLVAAGPIGEAGKALAVEPGPELGLRLSKSGTVHLADLDKLSDSRRSIYLPAGKLLHVYKRGYKANLRRWNLALTEDGLYIYLRTDGVHYYNPSEHEMMQSGIFAVVTRPYPATTESGAELTLTPSEVYRVVERKDFGWVVGVDSAKLPSLGNQKTTLEVKDGFLAVFEPEELSISGTSLRPFRYKSIGTDLKYLADTVEEKGVSKETGEAVLSLLNRRFISSKSCEEEIKGTWKFEGSAAVNVKEWLSPVEAKLSLGGDLESSFTYAVGSSFEVDRYARPDEANEEVVVEVKDEVVRDSCNDFDSKRRLILSSSRKESVDVTELSVQELKLQVTQQGFPTIRCRDDYFLLYDELRRTQQVQPDTAALFLSYYTRFTGGAQPATCN